MLDSRLIGALIADYRKQHNMTQLELAEHMHVSPQAISKWETGKSLPDIFTLIRLSKVLHIELSELLGENKELTNEMLHQLAPQQAIDTALLELEHVVQYAALIKPDDWNDILQDYDLEALTVQDIVQLAPLLEQETLIDIVHTRAAMIRQQPTVLAELAPFLTEDVLYAIVCGADAMTIEHMIDVMHIAPYYTQRLHDYLARHNEQITVQQMAKLAPFVEPELLGEFVQAHWEQYTNEQHLATMLALLPQPIMQELLLQQKVTYELLLFVIPFIDRALAEQLLEHHIESLEPDQLAIVKLLMNVHSSPSK
ncbi:helix-turn-helix transcriptional regulator [Paenibacillus campi]|uniref:helix-turn-helix domain-containing protein n=1 Tax=Paenibacillus campi TaxID=3106031 RepID=UPI002B000DB7|nr:helix-turn-helix transcriptional regulator [Paenibacillus sp. SGZ-1009]